MQRTIFVCLWAIALMLVLPLSGRAQAPAVPAIEKTDWAVTDSGGGSYIFEFQEGGKFRSISSLGTSGSGTWKQIGNSVHIEANGKFVEYGGTIEGGKIAGRAKSRRGRVWEWSAVRQEAFTIASSAAAPRYPPIAAAARAEGIVTVEVQVGEAGDVLSAKAVGGHPLLQQSGVEAAKRWKFNPTGGGDVVRNARLFFIYQMMPQDCRKRYPDPAPVFISGYQAIVKRRQGCIDY